MIDLSSLKSRKKMKFNTHTLDGCVCEYMKNVRDKMKKKQ